MAFWGLGSSSPGKVGLYAILDGSYVQGIALVAIGIAALFVAVLYLRGKNSTSYKLSVMIGAAIGVAAMVTFTILIPYTEESTLVLAFVGSFALVTRFHRSTNLSLIFSLLVAAVVYISLDDIGWLNPNGWSRVVIALAFGAVIYVLFHFLRAIASVFLNILNYWPMFASLAMMCTVEGVCVLLGYDSIIRHIAFFLY